MKKFYTVCGFPRSGNTLLTSILNQNPDIHFTGTSSLPEVFYRLLLMTGEAESYLTSPSHQNLHSLFESAFESYYAHREEKYIIERSTWMTPYSYPLYNDFCPNETRMIILVRSLTDIVKSYLNICKNSPGFYINQEYLQADKTTLYKSELEEKVDIIFRKEGWIDRTLYSIKWLIDNDHLENIRILDYDDLVKDPQKCIDSLYEYYNIPKYKHTFKDLKQVCEYGIVYTDMEHLKADLHTIRTDGIGKVENNIELPNHIIEKCDSLEIWKGKIQSLI